MATTTTRLLLRKPAPTDLVSVTTDINAAMDTLDSKIGYTICTSTTRPSTPFAGQPIFETDTGRTLMWTGSIWQAVSFGAVPPLIAVANTGAVTAPVTNQMIYDLSASIVKRWNGSTWLDCWPGDTATNSHEADFTGSGSFATNSASIVGWAGVVTTADITTTTTGAVANSTLTFNRGGAWDIDIYSDNPVVTAFTQVCAFRFRLPNDTGTILLGSGSRTVNSDGGTIRIAAGTALGVTYIQQSGATQTVTFRFRAKWAHA